MLFHFFLLSSGYCENNSARALTGSSLLTFLILNFKRGAPGFRRIEIQQMNFIIFQILPGSAKSAS